MDNSVRTLNPPSRVYFLAKPEGISSFAALGTLKKRIGTRKVGHTGTLDPFATGLLTAMSGKMTKAANLLSDSDKMYQAVIRFGEETDTCDPTGTIIAHSSIPEIETIRQASTAFTGKISQKPPIFSAVKLQGKRAYESARQGLSVDMPERQLQIHEVEILNWEAPDLTIKVRCSKGTYIRSLARDLGLACKSRAYCNRLRRLSVGPFSVDMANNSEIAENGLSPEAFCRNMGIPVLIVEESLAAHMRHGRSLNTMAEAMNSPIPGDASHILLIGENGIEIALLVAENRHWIYKIVF